MGEDDSSLDSSIIGKSTFRKHYLGLWLIREGHTAPAQAEIILKSGVADKNVGIGTGNYHRIRCGKVSCE